VAVVYTALLRAEHRRLIEQSRMARSRATELVWLAIRIRAESDELLERVNTITVMPAQIEGTNSTQQAALDTCSGGAGIAALSIEERRSIDCAL
jgi:hypothetical protein